MDPLTEKRKQIEREIVDIVLKEIESERLTLDQSQEITKFCIPKLKSISSEEDLAKFIPELAAKWPLFSGIISLEHGITKEGEKNIATDTIMDLVNSGNIEEAADLAKSANE